MPNVVLVVEYDGAGFHGWQMQPGLRTIQEELHRVLGVVLRRDLPPLHASGRTDAGVHAKAQVVSFVLDEAPDLLRLAHSVSSLMKPELSVVAAAIAPQGFHPRRSAILKHYAYTILNRAAPAVLDRGRVWHISTPLDVPLMQERAAELIGEHDFTSVRGAGCKALTAVRKIVRSEIVNDPPYVRYFVSGEGFLKQMVRNLAGTLAGFGRHRFDGTMKDILAARNRTAAGVTAPPQGLCLERVEYPPDTLELQWFQGERW